MQNNDSNRRETISYEYDGETFEFARELLSELYAIRETGAVNMLDTRGVQDVAEQCGFEQTIEFLNDRQRRRAEYMPALEAMAEESHR